MKLVHLALLRSSPVGVEASAGILEANLRTAGIPCIVHPRTEGIPGATVLLFIDDHIDQISNLVSTSHFQHQLTQDYQAG